ncbi:archaemetzincin family Zn-dependent metalloprotease [Pyrobaculum neutrophilum]|uniref:Peptidase zinc-dependent n=1 Tax=Pyrobaculum neutrophilum (strain DSM 2338 / JCM 9278 / NBRC 100436 / V24Sta) TaxID=444157 RepID=B1YDA2_PYRNV|nr:archaemetzincin family Zn-dependent metalloprotease [Pyrobaculum neutrophilum]ACB39765.1 peptidase zinc-dependent [Pyrobaculum neutrophilum V24Sta]
MKPRLYIYAPSHIRPVDVPEFAAVWETAEVEIEEFLDRSRGQCRADEAVKKLAQRGQKPAVYVLDCDGYYPGFNYVFGLAAPELKTAVVFTARLRPALFESRLAKEITHEAGHLYGLGHCVNPRCVMYFNSIYDTDAKGVHFCETCRRKLRG